MKPSERSGMMVALAGFVVLSSGDAVIKTMAGQWPPVAVAALRFTLGAVGLSGLLTARQGRAGFAMPMAAAQWLRGVGLAAATIGFFSAVFIMPLATATAITFASPVLTALVAGAVLGERVGRVTIMASLIAFVGVLIVLRPNFLALGWAALLPLLSACGQTMLMIGNRIVAGRASPLATQLFVAAIAAPLLIAAAAVLHVAGPARFVVGWPPLSVVARCALVACSASTAHWLIYLGTTRAGAATIAPMSYIQLLVATALGWIVFGDAPDAAALLGAGVIVGAGLWLWRAGPSAIRSAPIERG